VTAVYRPPDAPPTDSAAEAAMLWLLLVCPELVGQVDLGPLLWCGEHEAIWRAMTRVRARRGVLDVAEWWVALRGQLHDDVCRGEPLETHYIAADGGWQWRCQGWRYWNVLQDAELPNRYDLGPWLVRLERAAEARRLISAAQEMAVRAWRGDNEGALAILDRIRRKEASRTRGTQRELEPTMIWAL
jgi:hypothetical protein